MRNLLFSFFLLVNLSAYSQHTFTKAFSLPTDANIVTADVLGNIYIVKGSELMKYNTNGVLCCTFSNRNYGEITSVDARDPLRLLLFYKPFGIVLLLDNNLAEQSKIELHDLNIFDPLLACSSEIQGMWIYDNASYRLYKFNAQLQAVSLSNDLRQDVMENISPDMMMESDYWLVIREVPGILIFDKMGNYFKSIKLNDATGGQLIHDDWIYVQHDKLMRLNLRNGEITEVEIPFPAKNASIVLAPQRIIRLFDKTLEVYSY